MIDLLTLTDLTTELHMWNKMEIVDVNQVAMKESVVELSETDRALAAEEERKELELKALAKSKRQIASYLHTWEKPVVPVVPEESEASREEEKRRKKAENDRKKAAKTPAFGFAKPS